MGSEPPFFYAVLSRRRVLFSLYSFFQFYIADCCVHQLAVEIAVLYDA